MARTQKTSTGSCVASAMALFSCSLDVCTRSLTLSMHHFKSILSYGHHRTEWTPSKHVYTLSLSLTHTYMWPPPH